MPSKQQRIGRTLLDFKFPRALNEPFLRFRSIPLLARHPFSIAPERIRLRHSVQKIRLAPARQTSKRTFTNFVALLVKLTRLEMFAHERNHLTTHVVIIERVDVDASQKTLSRRHARVLVSTRTPASLEELSRRRLPKIMGQGSEHHRHLTRISQFVDQLARTIDRQLRVNKHVAFWMPFRILRHSDQI